MRIFGVTTVLLLSMSVALSAMGNDAPGCDISDPPHVHSQLQSATVTGDGRLYLLSDEDGCPSDKAMCQHGYLIDGDDVIAGQTSGAFTCVSFAGRLGESIGWVRSSRLRFNKDIGALPLKAWVGKWHDGDNVIDISSKGNKLIAGGAAYWPQPSANPEVAKKGEFNFGTFDAVAIPNGNEVQFEQGDSPADTCVVSAKKIGKFLVVQDNGKCGGLNVRFDGLYRQK
jgi:hypothetical protein